MKLKNYYISFSALVLLFSIMSKKLKGEGEGKLPHHMDYGLKLNELPPEIIELILIFFLLIKDDIKVLVALLNTCTKFATIVLNFMNKNRKIVTIPIFLVMFPDKKESHFELFCNSYSFFIKYSTEAYTPANKFKRLLTEPYKLFLNNIIAQHCSRFTKQEYNPLGIALRLLYDKSIYLPLSNENY